MMNDGNHPLFLLEKLFGKNSDAIIKNFHKLQKGLTQTCIKKTGCRDRDGILMHIPDIRCSTDKLRHCGGVSRCI
ncbi:hypothetical protein BLCOC_29790 [Blautia coccoides]|uniref:Uncharacterized protein n=1 Tax=Blautia producta TaxID=33035 RepID=A0ABZ0UBK1_9FIRM|nr:hypothetical protein EV205_12332 [Blautia coccoides]WPX74622.1 hypothetical protein BLCOC_29790 [Blautia coccoides]SUX96031.1 Uncharacterised protein [Blautia coccoides]